MKCVPALLVARRRQRIRRTAVARPSQAGPRSRHRSFRQADVAGTIPSVETDVPNKVRQTTLPKTRPMMPVFEAIVNAIHALEDRSGSRGSRGTITVEVVRRDTRPGETAHLDGTRPIGGFVIVDDGCGFDTANYHSFGRADSAHKMSKGGKGVGRFLWLAAFDDALITSVFEENGAHWRREFRFATNIDGAIEPRALEQIDSPMPTGSKVQLRGLRAEVASLRTFPRNARRIGELIAEHCTGYLLRPDCPEIAVHDGVERIDVNDLFRENSATHLTGTVELGRHRFDLHLIKSRPASGDTPHRVRLCADFREVKSYSLHDDLPHLPKRPWDGASGRRWVAEVYVSGDYLNAHVDSERARFRFEELDEAPLDPTGDPSMKELRKAIASKLETLLDDVVGPERERWARTVRDHIEKKSPRYHGLLQVAPGDLTALPPDLSPDRLEAELARMLFQRRIKVEQDLDRALAADRPGRDHDGRILEHISKLFAEVTTQQRDELAEYVLRRHATLAFLKRSLRHDPKTGAHPFERMLHDVIFPRKSDSRTLDPERANLWIIDERLSFADLVLSDLPLDNGDPNSPHPDLIVYDRTVVVADAEEKPRSVILFEFKQPGRTDYGAGSRNLSRDPAAQLEEQVYRLREGPVTTPDGEILRITEGVPVFAYLIADATDGLLRYLARKGWTAAADAQTHVRVDQRNNAIYQHLTWKTLLDTAADRHNSFFDRLNLPRP
jgi:hypothetical protein